MTKEEFFGPVANIGPQDDKGSLFSTSVHMLKKLKVYNSYSQATITVFISASQRRANP